MNILDYESLRIFNFLFERQFDNLWLFVEILCYIIISMYVFCAIIVFRQ